MPSSFSRTFRSLDAESEGRSRAMIFGATLVLAAWSAWFFLARLSVYVSSDTARLEVVRATQPIDSPVAGRVVNLDIRLDQVVHEGDVLVELDPQTERLGLAEARAKAEGLGPQLATLKMQIDAEGKALGDYERQSTAGFEEQRARIRAAEADAQLAAQDADRVGRLYKSGSVSEAEYFKARAESSKKSAELSALRSALVKAQHEFHTNRDDRKTRIASLQRDAAKLEADLTALNANVDTLSHSIELRKIRAPASGRVGELGNVRLGSVVKEGDRVGTIVGGGDLRVVAELAPAQALGRVRPGQKARVRFDGFPWTEFGDVEAQVVSVASEVRDGHARVDLTITKASPRIPLQHGLPGNVEIEIEKASPASLVLRAAGQLVQKTAPQPVPVAPTPPPMGPGR